jgi:hypothetical protein
MLLWSTRLERKKLNSFITKKPYHKERKEIFEAEPLRNKYLLLSPAYLLWLINDEHQATRRRDELAIIFLHYSSSHWITARRIIKGSNRELESRERAPFITIHG